MPHFFGAMTVQEETQLSPPTGSAGELVTAESKTSHFGKLNNNALSLLNVFVIFNLEIKISKNGMMN